MSGTDRLEQTKVSIRAAARDCGWNVKEIETAIKCAARKGTDVPRQVATAFGGQEQARSAGQQIVQAYG